MQNYPSQAPPTSGKATTSLVFGILGLTCMLPFIGPVIAIILGHKAYGEIRRSGGQIQGEGIAIGGLVTGYSGLLTSFFSLIIFIPILAGMLLPVLSKARDKARRVNDAGNLKQIGLACLMFSGDHNGDFPDDFGELVEQNYIMLGKVWICPATGTPEPTSAQQVRSGSNCDYVYVGKGLRDDDKNYSKVVIAYTKPNSFVGKWMNFLFIDGHVEGIAVTSADQAAAIKGWTIPNPSLGP